MAKTAMRRIALAILLLATACSEPARLTGTVTHVRDGDTIVVDRTPVRLNGVSAPELNDFLGPQARSFMTELVHGKEVSCELNGERSHDRWIGICYLDGEDIGAAIIEAGLARDCPRFSGGRYREAERAAQMIDDRLRLQETYALPGYC